MINDAALAFKDFTDVITDTDANQVRLIVRLAAYASASWTSLAKQGSLRTV